MLDSKVDIPAPKKLRPSPLMPQPMAIDGPMPLHLIVIEEARKDIQNLRAASNAASGEMGENLRAMVMSLDRIERDLIADSSGFMQVERLFTYYLPATTKILEARGRAATDFDDTKLAKMDAIMGRLASAFRDFALRLHAKDDKAIEIDIKLLDQALASEFGFENLPAKTEN
ncbi:MAG: hypothetical protein AAB680_05080 [Pseudomonadota bacterium]